MLMCNSLIQLTLVTVPWGPGHCHPVTLPDSVMWTNIFLGEFSFIPSQQSMILSDTDRPCHHHQRDIYNTTQDKYKMGQPFYGMARFARLIYLRLLLSLAGRWFWSGGRSPVARYLPSFTSSIRLSRYGQGWDLAVGLI